MQKQTHLLLLVLIVSFIGTDLLAQTTEITGQIRPRYEYRHGYKTLLPEGNEAASFISQRTRLNFKSTWEGVSVGISLQNVATWGETGTLSSSDINGSALHEAWAEFNLSQKISFKAGRQEIVYDDHRIFGNVGWAQQGRSHDAAILTLQPKKECNIDLGFAYNANRESLFKEPYAVAGNYRSLQFIHYHRNFGKLGVSFLFLNNGMQYYKLDDTTSIGNQIESLAYSQTLGTRLTYKNEKLSANAALYYQSGKLALDQDMDGTQENTTEIAAHYLALDCAYEFSEIFKVGAGLEILSGNDMNSEDKKAKAFNPLYGTNHKFNGWMDYFYVGNHINSVGLVDIFLPLTYSRKAFSASLIPHYFSSAGNISIIDISGDKQEKDNYLGTEIDLIVSYALNPIVTVKAGYSQMLPSESLELLKSTPGNESNNWAWIMLDIKPRFL